MKSFGSKAHILSHVKKAYATAKYAVEMTNITKSFNNGAIVANDQINIRVKRNTIHAIIGENGAGKSTLMSILFGIYGPDAGTIKINDTEVHFKSAQDASAAGIGMVHQHFKLVHVFNLLENIMLGAEVTKHGFLNRKAAIDRINEIAKKYDLPIDLNKKVSDASVGEQQRVEILKLLYRDSDILIFDEPTAVLSDKEIDGFLKMLLEFKKLGKTIIIITHKLNEVKSVADTTTVIRLGKYIGEYDVKNTTTSELANVMVGRQLHIEKNPMLETEACKAPVVLSIQNLKAFRNSGQKVEAIRDLSFDLHAGEILGIAGVEGNGQTELALILGGLMKPQSGSVKLCQFNDKLKKPVTEPIEISKKSVKELYHLGVAHVPEDRHKYGLILDETVAYNAVAPEIDQMPFSRFGFINNYAIRDYAKRLCNKFDVRGAHGGVAIARSLSGGNQQKLVFGREISRKHKLIVCVQPTRGLDLGAIQQIHNHLIEDAKNGAAVLLISYELDEIFNIASTVLVMNAGRVAYKGLMKNTTRQMVGEYFSSMSGGNHV